MAIAIIFELFFLFVIICSHISDCAEYKLGGSAALSFLFTITFTVGLTLGIISMSNEDKPEAIEVYRGNTELEITYRAGVPVDSTVIYKIKK